MKMTEYTWRELLRDYEVTDKNIHYFLPCNPPVKRAVNETRKSMKRYDASYISEGRRGSIKICIMPSSDNKIPIVVVKDIKNQTYTKFSQGYLLPEIAVRCPVVVYDQSLEDNKEKVISLILQWYLYPLRFQRKAKRAEVKRMAEVLLKYAENKAEE